MTFFSFLHPRLVFVPLTALVLAVLTHGATASAQAPAATGGTHHVEALAVLSVAPSEQASSAQCAVGVVCPPSQRPFPPGDIGFGARVGYRFRPLPYLELGAAPELSFHEDGSYFALPLMIYGRLPLRSGTAFTLGIGGGIAQARGDGDVSQTDALLRGELGAVIPVGGAWSVQILAQGSGGVHRFSRTPADPFDQKERLKWASLAFGPRYSF